MAKLTRIKGSQGLVANKGYKGGEVVLNDFDSKEPWNEMKIFKDEVTNDWWVRIYKFYTYYNTENGYISERQISKYKIDDNWILNPIFIDSNGNELAYVDVSAFLVNVETDSDGTSILGSKANVYPSRGQTLDSMKTRVSNYNSKYKESTKHTYYLYNIWASIMEQDLFTIEFANNDSTSVFIGQNYSSYKTTVLQNGTTVDVESSSGSAAISSDAESLGTYAMKYRGIENLIGGGHLVIDGIIFNLSSITVNKNGESFTTSLNCPMSSGEVKKLGLDKNIGLVLPIEVDSNSSYNDVWSGILGDGQILKRGRNSDSGYGIFNYNIMYPNLTDNYAVYRMIRRPE